MKLLDALKKKLAKKVKPEYAKTKNTSGYPKYVKVNRYDK